AVLIRLLEREQQLWKSGYEKIIGLRDMYSDSYLKISKTIIPEVNDRFIQANQKALRNRATHPDKISFCFAIMETEAWMLGLYEFFSKIDARLIPKFIKENLGIDLENDDPETT
ncbi:MAG: hypothetical protein ACE5FU_14180, partial [Nitrospinota bacterium]